MQRRLFLKLLSMPALALMRQPKSAPALRSGLVYSDSVGTHNLSVLQDGDRHTGIEYQP
jgi:hypothetical protein